MRKLKKAQKGGDVNDVKNFYQNYLNSPNYKKRLIEQGWMNPDGVIQTRLKNLNDIKFSIGSNSEYNNKKITLTKQDYNSPNSNTILAHELSHGLGADSEPGNFYLGLNANETSKINDANKYKKDTRISLDTIHNSLPTEMKADIDALRYNLFKDKIYNTGTETFNQNILNKAKIKYKGNGDLDRLFKGLNDSDLINIMNSVADNNSNQSLNIAKQGGKINDDNGYLTSNLHNYTPVKKINSNHITTDGMAFPIVANGIKLFPDTGDYFIPGDGVTERPLLKAQNGIQTVNPDDARFYTPINGQENTLFSAIPRPLSLRPEYDINGNPVNNTSVPVNPDAPVMYKNDSSQMVQQKQPSAATKKKTMLGDISKFIGSAQGMDALLGIGNSLLYKDPNDDKRDSMLGGSDNLYSSTQGSTSTQGSRGDWTTNEGFYQPDKKVVTQFQKGGDVNNVKNFYRDYLNSPNYRQRLLIQGYSNPTQVIKDRMNELNMTTITPWNSNSEYHPGSRIILLNKKANENELAHEFSHAVGAYGTPYPTNITLGRQENSNIKGRQNLYINRGDNIGEAKADIDALRFQLKKDKIYNTGTQDFNQSILDEAKQKYKNDPVLNRNFKSFSDKDLIYLMNNIAKNDSNQDLNVAQAGGNINDQFNSKVKNMQNQRKLASDALVSYSKRSTSPPIYSDPGLQKQYVNIPLEGYRDAKANANADYNVVAPQYNNLVKALPQFLQPVMGTLKENYNYVDEYQKGGSVGMTFGDNSIKPSFGADLVPSNVGILSGLVPEETTINAPKYVPRNSTFTPNYSNQDNMNTTQPTNSIPSDIKKDTILYLSHQQGTGGINAIIRDASGGKPVSSEIASNMKNNIGDDFYKKYGSLNAENFLSYWTNRFMSNYKKAIKTPTPWDATFDKAGDTYGLNPMFLKTVASIESDFTPTANMNKKTQYKGMFQIGTNEQKDLGITNPYDPIQSIYGGAKLIAERKQSIKFQEGGTYNLDDSQIADLKNQGYSIEYI